MKDLFFGSLKNYYKNFLLDESFQEIERSLSKCPYNLSIEFYS